MVFTSKENVTGYKIVNIVVKGHKNSINYHRNEKHRPFVPKLDVFLIFFVKIGPNCRSSEDNIDDNFHVNYFGVLHKSHFFEDHLDGLIGALPQLVWVVFVDGNGTDWLLVHKTFELFFR